MKPKTTSELVNLELANLRKSLPGSAATLRDARARLDELHEPLVEQLDNLDDRIAEGVLSLNDQERESLDRERDSLAKVLRDLTAALDQLELKINAADAAEQRGELEKLAAKQLPAQREYAALCGDLAKLVRDIKIKADRCNEISRQHSDTAQKLIEGNARDLRFNTVFSHPVIAERLAKRGPLHTSPIEAVRNELRSISESDLQLLEAIGALKVVEKDLRRDS